MLLCRFVLFLFLGQCVGKQQGVIMAARQVRQAGRQVAEQSRQAGKAGILHLQERTWRYVVVVGGPGSSSFAVFCRVTVPSRLAGMSGKR